MSYSGEENKIKGMLKKACPQVQPSREIQARVWKQVLREIAPEAPLQTLIFGIKPLYWAAGAGLVALILIVSGIMAGNSI